MDAISPANYSLRGEPPSPRLSGSSPCSRYSRAMHSTMEVSPRFGAAHPVFAPRGISRRTSPKIYRSDHEYERPQGDWNPGRPTLFAASSWKSSAEELFRFDRPKDRDDDASTATAEVATQEARSSHSSGVSTASTAVDLARMRGLSSNLPFKRKRPPKLETLSGGHLGVPSTFLHAIDVGEDALNEMTVEGSHYGISCKKGRREAFEDTHRAVPELNSDPGQAFFGVFDGHGGRKAADFASENLVLKITEAMDNGQDGEASMEAAVRAGYLATDAAFLSNCVGSGASCVTAVIKNGNVLVANAGDCRAVLSRSGTAEALTRDHRAVREDERQRIENLGGFVDNSTGTWRVQGTLAVTRGIGDRHLKEWICAEPEIQSFHITPDCEFMILASDGLWDVVSNQEAVDTAKALFQSECMAVEVMDVQMPLAMASSSLSKRAGDDPDLDVGHGLDEKPTDECSELLHKSLDVEITNREQDARVQPICNEGEDEVDLCVGTMDVDTPNVGFPEPRLPISGPVAACKKLVELSTQRGGHDDVSVMIVNLGHFQRRTSFVVSESSF